MQKENKMDNKIYLAFYLFITVGVAVLGNVIGKTWAGQPDLLFTPWLLALLVVSPLVFITFGISVSRLGVAVGSATIDSLLTLSTVFVGLFFLGEWDTLTTSHTIGLIFILGGIILMNFKFNFLKNA